MKLDCIVKVVQITWNEKVVDRKLIISIILFYLILWLVKGIMKDKYIFIEIL